MPRNRGTRTYVSITLGSVGYGTRVIPALKYVFPSGLKDSLRDNFGQTVVTGSYDVNNMVIAPNNITPTRASKFLNQNDGYEGSYCSSSAIATLRGDGYQISRLKFSLPANVGLAGSELYYAVVNGLKIGYRVNEVTLPPSFADATGLKKADANDFVIMGTQFPKLASAIYTDPTTGKAQEYACDPDAYDNVANFTNWKQGRPPLVSLSQIQNIISA